MPPPDRIVGVTIDGYAVEGGYDTEGGPATSFAVAQALGRIRPSLRSSATFEHLDDVVARIAELGVAEVCLTMEWARLEPRPGVVDLDAYDVYERAIRAADREGLSVVVVLCDAALPSWLGLEPWLSSWAPVRFAEHATSVGSRLDGRVRTIVTFRAPNRAASSGWMEATRPPFRRGAVADAFSALDGMLLAHQLAAEALCRAAPSTPRAIVFEASRDYGREALFRAVSAGTTDSEDHDASRRRFDACMSVQLGAKRAARRRAHVEVPSMRSTPRWSTTPPCSWWLRGDDAHVLAASLAHAEGTVDTVELGAGGSGWPGQLATAAKVLEAARTVHLSGALSSSGPLDEPTGLLGVDQHDGWAVGHPAAHVARAVGRLL